MSSVKGFGAVGDGKADDTNAVLHAVEQSDGVIRFPRGRYRLTRTIEIPLDPHGPLSVEGTSGGATVVMAGPGPAFRFVGTHGGTGDPGSVKPNVWQSQRMPSLRNLEITGAHAEADGVELIQTMQPVIQGVLIRQVRDGIRLHRRNRNVLICDSHIYHNTGVGVFLDRVNLHQINISDNHISYNRRGGIRIEGSEVRNLQITGNDIEYNNHKVHGSAPEPTAEIYIDTTAERASVNEVTVASNTIQATVSPGGCNLRFLEKRGEGRPPGLWTITGNIIGNQENSVHLTGCHGMVFSGNCIYSSKDWNVLIEQSSHITLTGNSFRRHTPSLHAGVRIHDSRDCVLSGCIWEDESAEGQASGNPLLELADCRRITIQGCQFIGGVPFGMTAERCREISLVGSSLVDPRAPQKSRGLVRFAGAGSHNLIANCTLSKSIEDPLQLDAKSGVVVRDCVGEGSSES